MGQTYIKRYVIKCWGKYLLVFLFILIQCISFHNNTEHYFETTGQTACLSVGDYIMTFYKGVVPYAMQGKDTPFNIPGIWTVYFIYFFVSGSYSTHQSYQRAEQLLLVRCTTRKKWWKYQSLLLCIETFGYLFVTWLAFLIFGICTGARLSGINSQVQLAFNGIEVNTDNASSILTGVMLTSLFVMLAMMFLQYLISICVNIITGIVVSIALLVSSVFYMSPFLPGNYLMVLRRNEVMADGMSTWSGILISLFVLSILRFISRNIIEKRDFI